MDSLRSVITLGLLVTAVLAEFAVTVALTAHGTAAQLGWYFGGLFVVLWTVLLGGWLWVHSD